MKQLVIYFSFVGEACNDYVDGVLNDMKADKEIFQDPYKIPEKAIEFNRKVVFVNYTGEARLYDGYIFGMSSLHRESDVVVDKNKRTHLKIWVGGGELKMQCRGKVKLMGHGPQVKVDAKVAYVSMKMDVVPTKAGSNPKIQNLKIESVKGLEVEVSEMGPLKFFVNQFIKVMGTAFKNLIKNAMETRLKAFMDKKIKEYEIPESCLNDASRRSLNFS